MAAVDSSTSSSPPGVPEKTPDAANPTEAKADENKDEKKAAEKKELRVRECPRCHIVFCKPGWSDDLLINFVPTKRGLWLSTNELCPFNLFS